MPRSINSRRFHLPLPLGVFLIIQVLILAFSASVLGLTSRLVAFTESSANETSSVRAFLTNATINVALFPFGFRRAGMWTLFAAGVGGTIDAMLLIGLAFWYQSCLSADAASSTIMAQHDMLGNKRHSSSTIDTQPPSSFSQQPSADIVDVEVVAHKLQKGRKTSRYVTYVLVFVSVIAMARSTTAVVLSWIEHFQAPRRISGSVIAVGSRASGLYRIASSSYTPENWVCALANATNGNPFLNEGPLDNLCKQATAARVLAILLALLDCVGLGMAIWIMLRTRRAA